MESEFLSQIEQEKVTAFLNDPILKEAIRKILLRPVYVSGVMAPGKPAEALKNFALNVYKSQNEVQNEMYSDEELGKIIKVKRMAVELVEEGFKQLEKLKLIKGVEIKSVNKAR